MPHVQLQRGLKPVFIDDVTGQVQALSLQAIVLALVSTLNPAAQAAFYRDAVAHQQHLDTYADDATLTIDLE